MEKIKKLIIAIVIIYTAGYMIVNPNACMTAASNALSLCGNTVVPSLFPFIFCSNVFIAIGAAELLGRYFSRIMRPIFNVSGAGALALVLGITSGYPIGASCAAELFDTGECSKCEAERLLAFCNNSGPMFVIGAVGCGMLKSRDIGIAIYVIHMVSALTTGVLFKLWKGKSCESRLAPSRLNDTIKNAASDIGAAVVKSVNTILLICGFVVVFSVICSAIPNCEAKKYIYSLLEITGGLKYLTSDFDISLLPTISAIIAFSGISVLMQVSSIVKPVGLSVLPYALGKICQSVFAYIITWLYVSFVPINIPTGSFEYTVNFSQTLSYSMIFLGVSFLIICAITVFMRIKRHFN